MIYVISKATFGDYNVRDIQCNANWCSCPYSDYALIPDSMVEDIVATCGYCDITLNSDGTEVVSFVARPIPTTPDIAYLIYCKVDFDRVIGAELDSMPAGGVKTVYVRDPNNTLGVGSTCYTVTMHKNDHNPFSDFFEHCYMADIEIHGWYEHKAFGVKQYNGDGADAKWSISDPKLVVTEEYMADHITQKGTTEDGWTWEKWASGKFEAWKWLGSIEHNPAEDLGSGNYFRYQYSYYFDLPFESMITPHVFVSLRSSGRDLLVGVTPEQGSVWYTNDSLSDALMDVCGHDLQDVQRAFELTGGFSSTEFFAALKACNGDAEAFCADLAEGSGTMNVPSALAEVNLTNELLQQAFNNAEPSRGSIHQSFTVLSPYEDSEHQVDADIHVIGTWKQNGDSPAPSNKETRYATIEDALAEVNATDDGGVLSYHRGDDFNVVLLEDVESASVINITKDCTLYLNGKKLSFTAPGAYLNINTASNVTINGEGAGSEITKNIANGANEKLVSATGTTLNMVGGTYSVYGTYTTAAMCVRTENASTSITMYGCTVIADVSVGNSVRCAQFYGNSTIDHCTFTAINKADKASGATMGIATVRGCDKFTLRKSTIVAKSDGTANAQAVGALANTNVVEDCGIYALSMGLRTNVYGYYCTNDITVTNCHIEADGWSDTYNEEGVLTTYPVYPISCDANSHITINGGYYWSARDAFAAHGSARINGGVFEGCQHGGAYMSGSDIKVKNAIFRCVAYTGTVGFENNSHSGAFYCGSPYNDDVNVYLDNCRFESSTLASNGIVAKNTGTEVFLSNCVIDGDFVQDFRVDGGNTIYIGKNVTYDANKVHCDSTGILDTTTYADQEFGF